MNIVSPSLAIAAQMDALNAQLVQQRQQQIQGLKMRLSQIVAGVRSVGRANFDAELEAYKPGAAAAFLASFTANVTAVQAVDSTFTVELPTA